VESLIAYGYIGVFVAAFLAATVLPFSSEAVLTGVLLAGAAPWPCFFAALAGNFLGGMTCYWVGTLGKTAWITKYLRMDAVRLQKIQASVQKRGVWSAFFVFLPGVGDFIAVALGFLRANVWWVAAFMMAGKALRYWVWMEFVFKLQTLL
jgi:membrane protein YqaA with SNARE-associated domain